MEIRLAQKSDIEDIQRIYTYARAMMRENGNPNQWGDNRPPMSAVENDIRQQQMYVIGTEPHGVFSFILGEDETYKIIEDGRWLNDEPYGTIHRMASDGSINGVLDEVLAFCCKHINNIRVDTHEDNKIMQHLLEKNGFTRCGIIYVDDGTPRIAYHKKYK